MCTGLGKVRTRDNATVWGTDQECKLRQPDDPFYKKFAAECSRVQIAIDVFAMGCGPMLDTSAGGSFPLRMLAGSESVHTRRCSHCSHPRWMARPLPGGVSGAWLWLGQNRTLQCVCWLACRQAPGGPHAVPVCMDLASPKTFVM